MEADITVFLFVYNRSIVVSVQLSNSKKLLTCPCPPRGGEKVIEKQSKIELSAY